MLSETLANLTRRIAEEFDHLSDSDASPKANGRGSAESRLTSVPRGDGADSSSPGDPRACAPDTARDDIPQSTPDAPAGTDGPVTVEERRPAKKAAATTAESESASGSKESSDAPRGPKDWQRTVIN